ncbi:MAG: iron-containing alcohol dehydrogenase, partial [Desulfobacterota bacterium]|nr:iron-containing alcohol dehydrogenase [Thermodesulfobacteriota bacterium]
MRFEFATAGRIIFGNGSVDEVIEAAPSLGTRFLIVTGKNPQRWTSIIDRLRNRGAASEIYKVPGEPTTETVLAGLSTAHEHRCDCVIAIGGGSVIDAGKAIAALMTNGGELFDYLEIVGRAMPLAQAPAPYIAVPTTAGTGSEVTRNAVIISEKHGVKVSLRSPLLLPALV